MLVFLTGATGFIGSHIVAELLAAGHQVLGMTRSDSGARALEAAGVQVHRGTLEEPETLRAGASRADAVIHTAFDHNFANFGANCQKDSRVIAAMGEALKGSNRPLIITSGTGMGDAGHGQPATEDVFNPDHPNPRSASEIAGNALRERGVNVSVVRLPQVHDTRKQGLISPYVEMARAKGVAAYVGDGANRWPAAHVLDVAKLYRMVLDHAEVSARYHAVAEEGVRARDLAEVIGAGLGVPTASIAPEEAAAHFGWLSHFIGLDMPASSALTRARLGWEPKGPGILEDLRRMDFSAAQHPA